MKLNYAGFNTPAALIDFVAENRIRPEQIQLLTSVPDDQGLYYWDDVGVQVPTLAEIETKRVVS